MLDKQACLFFKAICNETRSQVLDALRSGEKSASDLLEIIEIGQPTLSHHMKILVSHGVVRERQHGKYTLYSLNAEKFREISHLLVRFVEE